MVIVNVGRFSPEKGQLSLVDANRRLLPVHHDRSSGCSVATGTRSPTSSGRGGAVDDQHRVYRTHHCVADILAASDVFVMPSDYEGMPNAMMEAMAAGLPCVSTARSGARDVARDGIEALYYEPGDVATLVEHLVSLIADTDRAGAMGLAAKSRIREFDVDAVRPLLRRTAGRLGVRSHRATRSTDRAELMCGIFGSIALGRSITPDDVEPVRQGTSLLAHRGPDGDGVVTEGQRLFWPSPPVDRRPRRRRPADVEHRPARTDLRTTARSTTSKRSSAI